MPDRVTAFACTCIMVSLNSGVLCFSPSHQCLSEHDETSLLQIESIVKLGPEADGKKAVDSHQKDMLPGQPTTITGTDGEEVGYVLLEECAVKSSSKPENLQPTSPFLEPMDVYQNIDFISGGPCRRLNGKWMDWDDNKKDIKMNWGIEQPWTGKRLFADKIKPECWPPGVRIDGWREDQYVENEEGKKEVKEEVCFDFALGADFTKADVTALAMNSLIHIATHEHGGDTHTPKKNASTPVFDFFIANKRTIHKADEALTKFHETHSKCDNPLAPSTPEDAVYVVYWGREEKADGKAMHAAVRSKSDPGVFLSKFMNFDAKHGIGPVIAHKAEDLTGYGYFLATYHRPAWMSDSCQGHLKRKRGRLQIASCCSAKGVANIHLEV